MKYSNFLIVLLFFLASLDLYAGKRVTVKGVQYETNTDNTAAAILTNQVKGEVTILESVEIDKESFLVVQMNEAYFKVNNKITAITLPKSLKVIKAGAIRGCSKLTEITMPTGGYIVEDGAFSGSGNIKNLGGNMKPYLEYVSRMGGNKPLVQAKRSTIPLFSTFAEKTLKDRMQLWQKKKNYETVEQYKARVTEENRLQKMHDFEEDLKKEYAALYKPSNISHSLGYYDEEYGVFTIPTLFYGELYAKVPPEDAPQFRSNYNKMEVLPEFGVVNDTLAIVSCKFKLGDKLYSSTANYAGQGGSNHNFELPPLDISLAIADEKKKSEGEVVDNAVDRDIPQTKQDNELTFALIIGNEQYEHEQQVPFANNDARIFAEYCKKTLGIPNENVTLLQNAGLNRMRHDVLALANTLKAYDGEAKAIVYYAGHGVPDESSLMPYLLPTDGFAADIKSGYSLTEFYDELASAPSKMTMVFLDACFSGAKRDGQMLAEARGVAIRTRNTIPEGNLFVFSASQGNETAYSDSKHGHGMFTYYLLKHLQETAGNTSLSSLSDYVIKNVKQTSVRENSGKMQTPTVVPSLSLMNSWKDIKLR